LSPHVEYFTSPLRATLALRGEEAASRGAKRKSKAAGEGQQLVQVARAGAATSGPPAAHPGPLPAKSWESE